MQVEFWDLLELEPTWLRLFQWAQVVKTNDVNSSSNTKLKISENYSSMNILLKIGPAVKTLVDNLLNNSTKVKMVHPEVIFWCF